MCILQQYQHATACHNTHSPLRVALLTTPTTAPACALFIPTPYRTVSHLPYLGVIIPPSMAVQCCNNSRQGESNSRQ